MTTASAAPLDPPYWFYSSRTLDRVSVLVAVVACVAYLIVLLVASGGVVGYVSLTLYVVALWISRRRGLQGLLVAAVGAALAITASDQPWAGWILAIALLFSLGLRGYRVFVGALTVAVTLYSATVFSGSTDFGDPGAYIAFSTTIAAAATGSTIRVHESYLLAVQDLARDAVTSRDSEITRRVAEERLRIARDLHDVVGHEIAVISMNLGVIDVHLDTTQTKPRAALNTAQRGVQSVLQETQRILGVLRRGEKDPQDAVRAMPSAQSIPALLGPLVSAGAQIESSFPAQMPPVDSSVSVAAYRMAQEALTNAHRHGSGRIDVGVTCPADHLVITLDNVVDGTKPPSDQFGYGLIGMRERVEAAGGRLDIRSTPTRFSVTATMRRDGGAVS
ncbi:hypothetical protein GRS96_19945 (plasmid) [Rathayibacter sp. VKM Ac-2803]|uniref:histidine kinase n=1 Tax=Rathayibacter caricis DSM 15933 TaxID=1328867 RepID=A0A2T4UPA2_9MICO|nr:MULTISPECIES: histidine kinase [Rathayibacter]MWV51540.1 hypothetical protein [Rathayibacter sp. VKM Ac-2803]PTL71360.1 hypothetical protein C1I63_19265 [Rathayibacter caricis DSM 15933]